MTLGLPVGAVMNCADNSGAKNLYVISVKGIGARLNRLPAAGKDLYPSASLYAIFISLAVPSPLSARIFNSLLHPTRSKLSSCLTFILLSHTTAMNDTLHLQIIYFPLAFFLPNGY